MIMLIKLHIIFTISILININAFGQDSLQSIHSSKGLFKNLNTALTTNPDSVFELSLGNSNLREFPIEILGFKNLIYLSFEDLNIVDIRYNDSMQLSVKDRKLASKLFYKHHFGKSRIPDEENFPIRNRNKIKNIPDSISTLTKLEFLHFSKHQISRRQKKKLRRLLPKCEIASG
jgi:Leucine-rich repeat (LRR) protein